MNPEEPSRDSSKPMACSECQEHFGKITVKKAAGHNSGHIWEEPTTALTLSYDITGHMEPWFSAPQSARSIAMVASWIQNCLENHLGCKVNKQNATITHSSLSPPVHLPARLLDVGTQSQENVHIVSTSQTRISDSRYIALSYCWGPAMPLEATTTNASLEAHLQGIRVVSLPKTFVDAINLTRILGIRYLWIDALCIVQDSEEDWQRESARMSLVYSQAICTVAAAVSSDCFGGLFQARDVEANISSSMLIGKDQLTVFLKDPSWHNAFDDSPLNNRGWTLQERELSQSIIHYTKHQILWECKTLRASEIAPRGYPPAWLDLAPGAEDNRRLRIIDQANHTSVASQSNNLPEIVCKGNDAWHRMIEDYSSRHLKFKTDKFPALSGLVSEVQRLYGGTYVAGLWQEDILRDLLWRRQPADLNTQYENQSLESHEYIAPSWSWASINGRVLYDILDRSWQSRGWSFGNRHRYGKADISFEPPLVEHVEIRPSGLDPQGQLSAGFIRLHGRIKVCPIPEGTNFGIEEIVSTDHFDVDLDNPRDERLVEITILRVFTTPFNPRWPCDHPGLGLALQPIDASAKEYRRVGLVSGISRAWFEDGKDMSITLI